jgi:hypothetical protein
LAYSKYGSIPKKTQLAIAAEKRRLIDSVEKELPIPLFMFVRGKADPEAIEIIDGMQRLAFSQCLCMGM